MKFINCKNETYDGQFLFFCPGCGCCHYVNTKPGNGPVWNFNGDVDKPTVSPSLLVTMPNRTTIGVTDICHSFIKEGKIQYLSDCTHHLAGQTIDLPNIEEGGSYER